jgi:peptidoglycan/LPS O-acetylase OafA/YrhL
MELDSKYNNFNAIRFFSALQVMYFHSVKHLKLVSNNEFILLLEKVLRLFPGVTIFFFISGFLITHSYKKNDDYKRYILNRFLRIYPALWVCLIFSIIIMIGFGVINMTSIVNLSFWKWLIAQISFFQMYTPSILRTYGNGTPNGSLWTIPVEIQFYFLLPFLLIISKKINKIILILILLLSYVSFGLYSNFESDISIQKVFTYSILPSLWYFLIGVLFYEYKQFINSLISIKWMLWLLLYFLFEFVLKSTFSDIFFYHLFTRCLLAILIFTFAFQTKPLNLFIKYDLSYGFYLYHMVCINILVHLNLIQSWYYFFCVFGSTILFSYLSWIFIEKKCLEFK